MPRVAVLFTGGTISMEVDPVAGGNVPTLDGAAILARTADLGEIAEVVALDRGLTPASHFTFTDLFEIGATLDRLSDDTAVDGIVVVQGTDTIEETALFWDLLHAGPKPIVVTGAMRSASEAGYDGPDNLRDAVRAAIHPGLADQGVVVVLAHTIHPADDVTKTHASALTTFQSLNDGPLGVVEDGVVRLERRRVGRRHVSTRRAAERIGLVTAGVAMDGSPIDALVAGGLDGLVVAATGAGNTSPGLLDGAIRAMSVGIPVVLSTRTPAGRAGTGYAFPGGGATWERAGALRAGSLTAPKARIALALGLGAGLDRAALATLLSDPWP
ncbi:MAG: asparaginase [Chloroflexota bacterium]